MSYIQERDAASEADKLRLLNVVARRARLTPTDELKVLLPSLNRTDRSYLRNARPGYFGWDRLRYCAQRLGIRVEMSISEAA